MGTKSSRARVRTPRERRVAKGWDVGDVARVADLTPATYRKIEAGERRINVRSLIDAAEALDSDPVEFFAGFLLAGEPKS
jgi:transcriptional regulator with XRE-family HTH domain